MPDPLYQRLFLPGLFTQTDKTFSSPTGFKYGDDVEIEGSVSIGMKSQMLSIYPYIAFPVNAIKADLYFFIFGSIIQRECFAVPADSSHYIARRAFAWTIF